MRWPREFERVTGQKCRLKGTHICVYQWNTGAKKNFLVEDTRRNGFVEHRWTIPGKGDTAMQEAIKKAYAVAEEDRQHPTWLIQYPSWMKKEEIQ